MNRSSDSNDVKAQVEAIWTATWHEAATHVHRKFSGPTDAALVDDAITEATLRLHRHLSLGRPTPPEPAAWMKVVTWREYLRLLQRRDSQYGGTIEENLDTADTHSLAEVLGQLETTRSPRP